jgi:hypothetical protein
VVAEAALGPSAGTGRRPGPRPAHPSYWCAITPDIRQHDVGGVWGRRSSTGVEQHGHAVDGRERVGDASRQDPSGEVVDHGMEIGAHPVHPATATVIATTYAIDNHLIARLMLSLLGILKYA